MISRERLITHKYNINCAYRSFRRCTGSRSCRRDRCRLRRWSRPHLHNRRCWRCSPARSSRSRIYTNNCRANSYTWPRCDTRTASRSTRPRPARIACRWTPGDRGKSTRSPCPCTLRHFDRDYPDSRRYFLHSVRLGSLKHKEIARSILSSIYTQNYLNLKISYAMSYVKGSDITIKYEKGWLEPDWFKYININKYKNRYILFK